MARSRTAGSRQRPSRRRGIVYIRVSRKGKRGGDTYVTEEMQLEQCRAYAKAKGIRVVGTFKDVNRTGKNLKREGLQEALGMLERGEADTLIVAKLSRFARSTKDALNTLDAMEGWGATLVACDADIDTSTHAGKLLRSIMLAFHEFEVDLAAERWEEVRENAAAKGVYLRKPPPGYRKNGGRELVRDKEVGPLVEELFVGRASGLSWAELHRRWVEGGGPQISRQGLMTIIGNRTYLGGPHEALVSPEQFDAAQAVKAPRPWRKRNGSLLAGVLHCSISGQPMTSGGEDAKGRRSYRCQPGACKGHRMTITQEWVDKVVEEELLAWAGGVELEGTANGESGLIAAAREREAAEAELRAYVLHTKAVDADVYEEGLAARQAAVDEARTKESGLRSERRVGSVRVRLAEVWPELTTEERRQLVIQAVERVDVHPSSSGRGLGSYASDDDRMQAARERLRVSFRSDA